MPNHPPQEPLPNPIGAPFVLTAASKWEARERAEVDRLRELLAAARNEQLNPPAEKDGFDYKTYIGILEAQYNSALSAWDKFQKVVLSYDKNVQPEKRDAQESITRDEGRKVFTHFAIAMRTAVERYKEIAPRVREARSDEEAYTFVENALKDCLENALRGCVKENHLPNWCAEAVESVL